MCEKSAGAGGQLTESLDVPSQCSAVSACVGSSSGDLVLDKLENTKSELSPNSLNPQDLVLDVTEENDEDGIWSILTDNLHYLEVKSSFDSNPIKFQTPDATKFSPTAKKRFSMQPIIMFHFRRSNSGSSLIESSKPMNLKEISSMRISML